MLEIVKKNNKIIAIIIKSNFSKKGKFFFTDNKSSQQLGHFKLRKGEILKAHYHKKWKRNIDKTMEVLFIKKGCLKVNFFNKKGVFFSSKILKPKDAIILMDEAHGFEVLKNVEMIEVKQGPFLKDDRIFLKN